MYVYPKIQTVFERDKKNFKVIPGKIRCPEFENIKRWRITEKLDGRNQRVIYNSPDNLEFKGRTEKAEMPVSLLDRLKEVFCIEQFRNIFPDAQNVTLYLEAIGPKIQKGGGNYCKKISFRIFDVYIDGWWLEWDNIKDIASKLNIKTVPDLGIMTLGEAIELVASEDKPLMSIVAKEENNILDFIAEGIVATACPMVLFRRGNPVKWKLKRKDFLGTNKNTK
ncbi:MAG: hypothetical protein DRH33_04105 [Candidatus Nealsonbacteria bacterium]|nr:MAG: hypothetical protein DRH33_04105 [Candidatus Nealsonbacteria bacterium]